MCERADREQQVVLMAAVMHGAEDVGDAREALHAWLNGEQQAESEDPLRRALGV